MPKGLTSARRSQSPVGSPMMYPELEGRTEFGVIQRHRFEIPRQHSAESYVGWLKTDSLIATLDRDARDGSFDDIASLIDAKFNGMVSRNFLYEIISAQRIS
jgi:hypothetical protein